MIKDTASSGSKHQKKIQLFYSINCHKLCSEMKYMKYINILDKNIFEIKLFDIQLVGFDCFS